MNDLPPPIRLVIDKQQLLEKLRILRDFYRSQENESAEDAILDVMDIVTGWCSPRMKV